MSWSQVFKAAKDVTILVKEAAGRGLYPGDWPLALVPTESTLPDSLSPFPRLPVAAGTAALWSPQLGWDQQD